MEDLPRPDENNIPSRVFLLAMLSPDISIRNRFGLELNPDNYTIAVSKINMNYFAPIIPIACTDNCLFDCPHYLSPTIFLPQLADFLTGAVILTFCPDAVYGFSHHNISAVV